jgi:hypothetical protein
VDGRGEPVDACVEALEFVDAFSITTGSVGMIGSSGA